MSYSEDDLSSINYELLVEDALRTVVRGALSIVEHTGLPGETHFYISFKTDFDGVDISEELRSANPAEMTIVLQHQFWDLHVKDDHFTVTLSFSGVPQKLVIPFAAVTHFNDPSVGFGLQFTVVAEDDDVQTDPNVSMLTEVVSDDEAKPSKSDEAGEVVSLDAFRKKP
jgi:hypothetical protein